MPCMHCTFDVLHIYIRLLFGIACLAYHTAIKFALYQPLYPEFIVNYCFDIKRAAATFALFACTLNGKHNYIYRITKAQYKMTKDFTKNNQITDEQHVVLRDLDRIMVRWKGCIDKLLNEENHRSVFDDEVPNDGYTRNQQE